MSRLFRVGLTRDFLTPEGTMAFGDIGLGLLEQADGVDWNFLPERVAELRPDDVRDFDALLVLGSRVTSQTLSASAQLVLVARFGVGYDNVDVSACTERGVLLTITPDGVRRPVAVTALTLLLALTHKLLIKDRLTREGRWDEKLHHMGMGVTGRTLGVIGLGSIGSELVRLAQAFDLRCLGCDPFVGEKRAAELGVGLVDLDTLMAEADYICVCCALTNGTRRLVSGAQIARMKPTAFLINVARGPIVDQSALTEALQQGRIAGAGLDVFETEPPDPNDPLLRLDNVILAPHALCWTDECFHGNGSSACRSILEVAKGRVPETIVNRAVLDHPGFQEKLARFA